MRTGILFVFFLMGIFLASPALAGTKYMAGSPELSAYIAGTNEFRPGSDVQIVVVVENSGVNEFKFIQSGIVDRDDQPNTAKFLTAALSSGDAPVVIKSDPQMLGDLKGAASASASFSAKIRSDAASGIFELPLTLKYTYLDQAEQYGVDTVRYYYKVKNETILVPITIRSDVSISVVSANPDTLNAGTEGYVDLMITNSGSEDGSKAVVRILRNGNSPVIPTDSSVYIGDFPVGGTVSCRYKVSVSGIAQRQSYPIDVVVVYQNREGDFVTSRNDTIGIPVGGKAAFGIISPAGVMNPGNKKVIAVAFKNTGETAVYSAQARISAVDPFTSNDDIAYIGDLGPGESRVASFVISVDRGATIKEYGLDSEIRYRDALENTYISDLMKVKIDVVPPDGLTAIVTNPLYISILVAALTGAVYLVLHFRRKNRR